MLPFGSLNHAQDHGINGQTACPLLEGERTYGRHSEIDAIDPIRSWHTQDTPQAVGDDRNPTYVVQTRAELDVSPRFSGHVL